MKLGANKVMYKILVTGGAGFIGSNFIRLVLQDDHVKVINLDKLTYAGNLVSLQDIAENPRYTFTQGDIGDRGQVSRILAEHRPRAVINFAAESHVDRSLDGPDEFIQTNVFGTFYLLDACLRYWADLGQAEQAQFRFLQVSTDEVYGALGAEGYFSESTAYAPNSPYAASKASADHVVRAYYQSFGLPVLTTNCSNNYGPYQFPEKLIPMMILNAIEGKPLPVYGTGENIRDWLYVLDHCQALWTVLDKGIPGQVYNIGGNSEMQNIAVVQAVCAILDKRKPRMDGLSYRQQIVFVEDRPGHDSRYAIDASKIKADLGWQAKESFSSGLSKTVTWYLENLAWCRQVQEGSYERERLGLRSV